MPLRLTPAERDAIALAAAVVTPDQRSAFANMVRGEFSGLPPMCRGEGSLHRVIAECQKSFANRADCGRSRRSQATRSRRVQSQGQ